MVFSFVEVFAGESQATLSFRSAKHTAARLDMLYMSAEHNRQNPMDLLTDSGFLTLDGISSPQCFIFQLCFLNQYSPIVVLGINLNMTFLTQIYKLDSPKTSMVGQGLP